MEIRVKRNPHLPNTQLDETVSYALCSFNYTHMSDKLKLNYNLLK